MPWLILDTALKATNETAWLAAHALANTTMGYPNASTKTIRYAEPVWHPNGRFVAFPIQGAFEKDVTDNKGLKTQLDAIAKRDIRTKVVASLPPEWRPNEGID